MLKCFIDLLILIAILIRATGSSLSKPHLRATGLFAIGFAESAGKLVFATGICRHLVNLVKFSNLAIDITQPKAARWKLLGLMPNS